MGVMKFKIGELAKMTGCQVVTIRYYEKEGLLPEPERTGSNYRLYDESAVERLHFIRHCRLHGMDLGEIKDLLAFKDHPTVNCDWIHTLVKEHLKRVDKQIAELQHLKGHLQKLLEHSTGEKDGCGIIAGLNAIESCPYCENRNCKCSKLREERNKGIL